MASSSAAPSLGTSPGPPTPLSTSTSSSNNGGQGNGNGTTGANYFFGFIITFVVLLLVFVSCGFSTRHRTRLRFLNRWTRHFFPADPDNDHDADGDGDVDLDLPAGYASGRSQAVPVRPVFWDLWLKPLSPDLRRRAPSCDRIQPLSTKFVPSPPGGNDHPSQPQDPSTPSPSLLSRLHLRRSAAPLRQQPPSPPSTALEKQQQRHASCDVIQLAALIAMPVAPGLAATTGYDIGVVQLPYTPGEVT